MDARSLVCRVGETICGSGRLVRTGDGDWFDPPLPVPAIGYGPEGPPPPRPTNLAIPVRGADFTRVASRYERDGAIEGYATISGSWRGDHITIDHQTTEQAEQVYPNWTDPPCPPPAGGWPHGMNEGARSPDNLEFDVRDLEATGAAVTVVTFRPSDDQAVLVVAATDIPAVEAALQLQLPGQFCVVPSRWTRKQLHRAQRHLSARFDAWGIYQVGEQCDEQAQATMVASLVRVTDEIADWVEAQPSGLCELRPCLSPALPLDLL